MPERTCFRRFIGFSARSSRMIYSLSLKTALLLVGLVVVALHAVALMMPAKTQAWLKAFPRSEMWGTVLILGPGRGFGGW